MNPITVDGVTFPPVLERRTRNGRHVTYHPAQVNGKPLYAVPGGLMAFADDLPRIAEKLRLASPTKSGRFSP